MSVQRKIRGVNFNKTPSRHDLDQSGSAFGLPAQTHHTRAMHDDDHHHRNPEPIHQRRQTATSTRPAPAGPQALSAAAPARPEKGRLPGKKTAGATDDCATVSVTRMCAPRRKAEFGSVGYSTVSSRRSPERTTLEPRPCGRAERNNAFQAREFLRGSMSYGSQPARLEACFLFHLRETSVRLLYL